MTDQLEHDLRTMLAERARAVATDPTTSEQAIADRLRSGDEAVAAVLPLVAHHPRRRWLAAVAAVAALVVVGGAIALVQDDPNVRTGPSDQPTTVVDAFFVGSGTADEVVRSYLADRLDVAPGDVTVLDPAEAHLRSGLYQWTRTDIADRSGGIVGVQAFEDGWKVVEAYSDGVSIDAAAREGESITISTTRPAASTVEVSLHDLGGEEVSSSGCGPEDLGGTAPEGPAAPQTCTLVMEPVGVGAEPLTVRLSMIAAGGVRLTLEELLLVAITDEPEDVPSTTTSIVDDPTLGTTADDSARDVAERFTRAVLGTEYIALDAEDSDDGLTTTLTLEGEGNVMTAIVVYDGAIGRHRLIRFHDSLAKFLPNADNPALVVTPAAGELTITVYGTLAGGGPDLSSAEVAVDGARIDGPGTQHGPYDLPEHSWIQMELVTEDGQTLRYFSTAGYN